MFLKDIVTACQKLYAQNLVANHDGNITFKIDPDETGAHFIATPTSFSKSDVTETDLLWLDQKGKVIRGPHKVFSEVAYHLVIYKARPDVQCVIHAHPPVASAFGLAGKEIGTPALPEAIVSLGRHILNTKFISPLDLSILEGEVRRVLMESDAFVIPGNGAWTVGQSIMQTYYRMELVEHVARQYWYALPLGGVKPLAEKLVADLMIRRPKVVSPKVSGGVETLRELVQEEVRAIFLQE